MENRKSVESVLKLNKIFFDKIEFNRLGFENDNDLEVELQSNISKRKEAEVYKVTLIFKGKKPEEYTLEISLCGIFSIETDSDLAESIKNALITKNSVAILMPYLRSEVSLLTAQPEMKCVVLPAFNVNNMVEGK